MVNGPRVRLARRNNGARAGHLSRRLDPLGRLDAERQPLDPRTAPKGPPAAAAAAAHLHARLRSVPFRSARPLVSAGARRHHSGVGLGGSAAQTGGPGRRPPPTLQQWLGVDSALLQAPAGFFMAGRPGQALPLLLTPPTTTTTDADPLARSLAPPAPAGRRRRPKTTAGPHVLRELVPPRAKKPLPPSVRPPPRPKDHVPPVTGPLGRSREGEDHESLTGESLSRGPGGAGGGGGLSFPIGKDSSRNKGTVRRPGWVPFVMQL